VDRRLADYGIVGPGETALPKRADCGAAGEGPADIKGLVTKGADRGLLHAADGTEPPRARHDPGMVRYYWQHCGMLGVQTKRGCPRRCIYCTYPLLEGREVHCFDTGPLIEELARLRRDFNVRYVFFVDAVFNTGSQRELELAAELEKCDLGISWGAFFSPAGVDRPYLETLKRAGLTHVEFGTDSLCEPVLDRYGKGFCFDDVVRAGRAAESVGVHAAHYLVFGGPGETRETVAETLKRTEQLGRAVFFPCVGMRIYPGTPLHDLAVAEGRRADGDGGLRPAFYFAPEIDPAWLSETVAAHAAGRRNWLLPSGSEQCLPAVQKLRLRGRKGPLWEHLALSPQREGARKR